MINKLHNTIFADSFNQLEHHANLWNLNNLYCNEK